ncbi:alkaline shock response membrane anchor protein AmaP [Streptomyces sp. NPDC050504]|uniref:alkaline shock response membrane anchor protein AmaP n=1 Tax=Streptomyces sp. NPDC050504 TaxID=3365618 RepID=UPI0037A733CC
MLKSVNRVAVGAAGLVLIGVGGAVLAAGLGLSVPHWWPFDGRDDVLLSAADRGRWRDEGWWWPAVIGSLAVLALLGLWWLLAQLRRARLSEVLVDSGDGEGALLRGRAMEAVLTGEAQAQEGVARARVALTGRRSAPEVRMALMLEPHAGPGEAVARLAEGAVEHARGSAGLARLPTEVRVGAVRHGGSRVQ